MQVKIIEIVMGGYPDSLILLEAYVRWGFTGFKRKKLESYLSEDLDKSNFIISILFILGVIYLISIFSKVL